MAATLMHRATGSHHLLWLPVLLLLLGVAPAQAATAPSVLPTLTTAFADAAVVEQASKDFETYPLIVKRVDQRGGIKGNLSSTRTAEGELNRIVYRFDDAQPATVMKTIQQSLADIGFQPLYDCTGAACGPTFTRASPGFRQHRDLFNVAAKAQHYLALQKQRKGGDVYVSAQAARANAEAPLYLQVDVIQVEPRVASAITVNAAEMARKLETSGRVALYGLFFATDSAEIKPASRSTLAEIAKLLASKPQLKLLVVGHTDSQGSFEYNLKLSRQRAHAVVDALVDNYGIDPQRLKPWGVSYAAPRATNKNQIGRSRNRRVELVIW